MSFSISPSFYFYLCLRLRLTNQDSTRIGFGANKRTSNFHQIFDTSWKIFDRYLTHYESYLKNIGNIFEWYFTNIRHIMNNSWKIYKRYLKHHNKYSKYIWKVFDRFLRIMNNTRSSTVVLQVDILVGGVRKKSFTFTPKFLCYGPI